MTYTLTAGSDAVSGAVSGVTTLTAGATSFTKSTLTIIASNSKPGYCGRVTGQAASYSDNAYIDLPFTVASGYIFNPSSVSVKVNVESATDNMKAKVAIIDNSLNVVSNELSCIKNTDNSVSFASGAFTSKLYTGTVHIRIYLYGVTSKYAYIKSPITITGTVAEAASGCESYSFHYGTHDASDWTTKCFEYSGAGDVYYVNNFIIPNKPNFYVGNQGVFYNSNLGYGWGENNGQSRSFEDVWSNLPFAASQGDGSGTRPKVGAATGAKGKIRVYDTSNWNNMFVAFEPDGYVLYFNGHEYPLLKQ